jgi:hypothetical protein
MGQYCRKKDKGGRKEYSCPWLKALGNGFFVKRRKEYLLR